jgi:uncharacterized protein YndB with AHSA1/START domain
MMWVVRRVNETRLAFARIGEEGVGLSDSGLREAAQEFLLIADVSGYTAYLQASELQHAQSVLADLIETIVGELSQTFSLVKLEGDAVFVARAVDQVDPSRLVPTIEDSYSAFRSRLRDITFATTCECNACRLIPTLELKLVAHCGEVVRSKVAGSEELVGPAVVLSHRLLKNSVVEDLGITAYALFTAECVNVASVDLVDLRSHSEVYEDVGPVDCYALDLHVSWDARQAVRTRYVGPDESALFVEVDLPSPPSVVWEYVTDPDKRLLWRDDLTSIDQVNPSGGQGRGSVNHCAHGRRTFLEKILDWKPFDYVTTQINVPFLGDIVQTTEFEERPHGTTRLTFRLAAMKGLRGWIVQAGSRRVRASFLEQLVNLQELLESNESQNPAD